MHPYPFHIEVVFKVVETFFHGIFVTIDFKRTNLILDIVRGKHKPAYPVALVLCNGFLVIFGFDAPDRRFPDEEKFFVIGCVFLNALPAQDFLHTAVQGVVKFLLIQCRLEAVIVNMDIKTVSVPCHWFCDCIKFIAKYGAEVMV